MQGLNSRECGTLEAADILLGHSMFGIDKDTTRVWVKVNMIRSRQIKRKEEIEQLDSKSTDIFVLNVVDDYYPKRPEKYESLSLYDFVKWYDKVKTLPVKKVESMRIKKFFLIKEIDHILSIIIVAILKLNRKSISLLCCFCINLGVISMI